MRTVDGPEADRIVDSMRWFLRRQTGCVFAAGHAKDAEGLGRIVYMIQASVEPADADQLAGIVDSFFDSACDEECAAMMIFPELRTSADIVDVLGMLIRGQRWSIETRPQRRHPHDDVLVALWWETNHGPRSSVMGLAPVGEMPVTRRAPFVAITAWPGPPKNPHRPPKPGEVGFPDMPLQAHHTDRSAFEAAWDTTRENVRSIRAFPLDGAARPDVAFSLPSAHRGAVAELELRCREGSR